jgi:hypothetical protein
MVCRGRAALGGSRLETPRAGEADRAERAKPTLGLALQPLTPALAQQLGHASLLLTVTV